MQGLVMFAKWAGFALGVAIAGVGDNRVELTMRSPNGQWSSMKIIPAADNLSVKIDYATGEGTHQIRKKNSFDGEVLADLMRAWGAPIFDISKWRSETGCDSTVSWRVSAAGQSRTICHDDKITDHLSDFQAIIQLLMNDEMKD